MASTTKRARFLTNDTNAVLEMLDEEGSDNKGMSSDEESLLNHQLTNESDISMCIYAHKLKYNEFLLEFF